MNVSSRHPFPRTVSWLSIAAMLLAGATPGCGGSVEGAASAVPASVVSGKLSIYEAARTGNLSALSYFIGDGADLDAPDAEGNTALHYAAASGNARTVRLLLVAGVRRDIVDAQGRTALDVAYAAGKTEAVKHLSSETILP